MSTYLCDALKIKYPIIMAPMFLISDEKMILEAINSGITGAIPSLNYRTNEEFEQALMNIREKTDGPFGINLIVSKSNPYWENHLEICIKQKVTFIITSLGSPKKVIEECKKNGILVFCDVVNIAYAKKVEEMGADAIIAVNSGAGGHAGNIPATVLVPQLKKYSKIPVISAGGIGDKKGYDSILSLGADGLSIGSPFIGAEESPVNKEYKEAVINYGAQDIILSSKLSGTPCTVINTPYMQKIGSDQNIIEAFLNKNRKFKKLAKQLTFYKGMKMMKKAAFQATYKSVWCAGPSIEFTKEILPVKEIVKRITQ